MNRSQLLLHLCEARDAMEATIRAMRADPSYGPGEYGVDMQHIYHHLNTAWNSRNATPEQVEGATDADFNRWSALPPDLPMISV